MSLSSNVDDLATRVATEFNTLRTEVANDISSTSVDDVVVITAAAYAALGGGRPSGRLYLVIG